MNICLICFGMVHTTLIVHLRIRDVHATLTHLPDKIYATLIVHLRIGDINSTICTYPIRYRRYPITYIRHLLYIYVLLMYMLQLSTCPIRYRWLYAVFFFTLDGNAEDKLFVINLFGMNSVPYVKRVAEAFQAQTRTHISELIGLYFSKNNKEALLALCKFIPLFLCNFYLQELTYA